MPQDIFDRIAAPAPGPGADTSGGDIFDRVTKDAAAKKPSARPDPYHIWRGRKPPARDDTPLGIGAKMALLPLDIEAHGMRQMGSGGSRIYHAQDVGDVAGGVSDIARGAMTTAAVPALTTITSVPAAVGAGAGLIAGTVAGGGAELLLRALGTPEGYAELAGTLAGLGFGVGAGKVAGEISPRAIELLRLAKNNPKLRVALIREIPWIGPKWARISAALEEPKPAAVSAPPVRFRTETRPEAVAPPPVRFKTPPGEPPPKVVAPPGVRFRPPEAEPEPRVVPPPGVKFKPPAEAPSAKVVAPPGVKFKKPLAEPKPKAVRPPGVKFKPSEAPGRPVAPPPVTFRQPAAPEAEAPPSGIVSPTGQPVSSATEYPKEHVDPREIGFERVRAQAKAKDIKLANRFIRMKLTEDQVAAMSDEDLNAHAKAEGFQEYRGKGLSRTPSAGKADLLKVMRSILASFNQ